MYIKKLVAIILICMLFFVQLPFVHAEGVSVSAVNAVLMEQESGRVLFEKDAHEKKKIASITKIMTAIIAIESGKLNDMVTVSDQAYGTEGSSLYLQKGQKMKLEDLVYGLMLKSGNDAAVAIAEHVGGSLDGFVYLMNQKAEEIGMRNSSFSNPHGLDNTKKHYSTAYDMALLTRYAMNNEIFAKISGTKTHQAPNPNEAWDYKWGNKNKMLKLYRYSTGGKTGYTKLAKRTLVSTAEKDGFALVAVTLNAGDDWNDHISMFEEAYENYTQTKVLSAGKLKKIKNSFYKNKVAIIEDFEYPLTKEEQEKINIQLTLIKPKKAWSNHPEDVPRIVGKAYIKMDEEIIGVRNVHYEPGDEPTTGVMNSWGKIFLMLLGIRENG